MTHRPHGILLRQIAATWFAIVCAVAVVSVASAQSLEERLDDDAFVRGLLDLEMEALLDHYLQSHPPSDDARAAEYRIAAEQLRARRTGDDPRERRDVVDRILALRRDLIAAHPSHPRRAVWQVDQAADLLLEVLERDATGLTVLLGVPSAEQRARALDAATEAETLLEGAADGVHGMILELESRPGYREDEGLQHARRRLAREVRDRRIPFLQGKSSYVLATVDRGSDTARIRRLELTSRVLEPLFDDVDASLARQARVYAGLARIELDQPDAARTALAQVRPEGAPRDVLTAGLARIRLIAVGDGAARGLEAIESFRRQHRAVLDGADGIGYRMLLADQAFWVATRSGGGPNSARAALDAYRGVLDDASGSLRDSLQNAVLERLDRIAITLGPRAQWPVIVRVARAHKRTLTAEHVEAGIIELESLLAEGGIAGADRTVALVSLASALRRVDRNSDAARRLTQLAAEHPGASNARDAIRDAALIARAEHRAHPGDGDARAVLEDALAVMFAAYPELSDIDRWRFVAGRLAMERALYDEATHHFNAVAVDAPQGLDARFMYVNALRADARATEDPARRAELTRTMLEAAEGAVATVMDVLPAAPAERRRDLRYYISNLLIFQAEAYVEGDRPAQALEVLANLESTPGIEAGVVADALRYKIAALQALDRPADAEAALRAFIDAAPEQAGVALDAMLERVLGQVDQLIEDGDPEAAQTLAARDAAPIAEQLVDWVRGRETSLDPARRDQHLRRAAHALRAAGRFGPALRLYDALLVDNAGTVELLFGRAECLFGLGGDRLATAISIYQRIVAAGVEIGHDVYWHAHLRTLQILDRAGRNTNRIAPRIKRLRLEDPALGGARYRREFERLERRHPLR